MKFRDLVIKDMKNVLYDVKSLAIILLMPMVVMSILGMSLQGVFGEEGESGVAMTRIGVVKAYDMEEQMAKVAGRIDLTAVEETTMEGLNPEKTFFLMLDNKEIKSFIDYDLMSRDEGIVALEAEEITALIVLPEDFVFNSYMLLNGSRLVSDIDYIINPENDFFAGIILGIIDGYVETTNHIYAQQRLTTMTLLSTNNVEALDNMGDLFDSAALEVSALNLNIRATQREESINSFQYYAAAIMCMFLLYTAGIGGRALLQERNEQTIPRLTVGGHGLEIIVWSNFVRVMCLALVQSGIMILYSKSVLGVDWGSGLTVIITMVLASFAVAGIGMLVAVITLISGNFNAANAFEFGLVYVMSLIGGSFIPVEGLPKILQQLGFLSVNGQALKMFINGMYNLPLVDSLTEMTVLLSFGLIFILFSMLLIRRKGRSLVC